MKEIRDMNNEKGFILVLALVIMAAMTAIGLAIITSSTTDMLISRNETEAKKAFYLAEAGIQEALGRMHLVGNPRFVGENSNQMTARINNGNMPGGAGMYTTQTFTSADLSLPNLGGTYNVTVNYALADGSSWCYGPSMPFNTCDSRIVLYGQDFGFLGPYIPTAGYVPLYQIDSTGTTASGTKATVREYVSASTLNVIPPAGNVFANTNAPPGITLGGSGKINGQIAGDGNPTGSCGTNCQAVTWPGSVDMGQYLGIPTDQVKQFADYVYNAGGTYSYTWGTLCNTGNTGNPADSICPNPSELVYIDNASSTTAILHDNGRGILIITGNAHIDSNIEWEGLIYIMGNLDGNGTVSCYGDIMVNNTINFNGTINDYGSNAVASSVAQGISLPRELRWAKIANP